MWLKKNYLAQMSNIVILNLNQKDLKDVLNIYTENISGLPVESPAQPLLNVLSNTDLNDKNLSNVNTAEITTGNILNINSNFFQHKITQYPHSL